MINLAEVLQLRQLLSFDLERVTCLVRNRICLEVCDQSSFFELTNHSFFHLDVGFTGEVNRCEGFSGLFAEVEDQFSAEFLGALGNGKVEGESGGFSVDGGIVTRDRFIHRKVILRCQNHRISWGRESWILLETHIFHNQEPRVKPRLSNLNEDFVIVGIKISPQNRWIVDPCHGKNLVDRLGEGRSDFGFGN